jgi:hypothetical protein
MWSIYVFMLLYITSTILKSEGEDDSDCIKATAAVLRLGRFLALKDYFSVHTYMILYTYAYICLLVVCVISHV